MTKDERSVTHRGNFRAISQAQFLTKVQSRSGPKAMAVWVMPLKTEGHIVEEDKVKEMRGEGVKR
jgi:hypothetical protein